MGRKPGRRRNDLRDNKLPDYVYRGRSAFEWKPYIKGGKRRTIRLCALSEPISRVWATWEEKQGRAPTDTLGWLLDTYLASREFTHKGDKSKSEYTIDEQRRQATAIKSYALKNGKRFAEIKLPSITRGVIRKYLDARAADGASVLGNRERSLISSAWNWALERDLVNLPNPCGGVRRNPESPRGRYVTDTEYEAVYTLAGNGPPYIRPMMELAYLCRMRKGEILRSNKKDIQFDGFNTRRMKGSRDSITEWSDRLRMAIKAVDALPLVRGMDTTWLLHDKYGQPIKASTSRPAW